MRKLFLLIFIFLFIAGCATLPSSENARNIFMTLKDRKNQLMQVRKWQLHGLLGIRTPEKSESVYVNWKQNKGSYTINLFGTLNFGASVVKGDVYKATLQTSDGKIITANSEEELFLKVFGWHLPVNNLQYWIRGLPAPHKITKKTFDRYNHLVLLQQQNWQVEYLLYTAVNNIDLPSKIILSKANLSIKIIISKWMV